MSEREEPSEQPCREGVSINPPSPVVPVGMFSAMMNTTAQMLLSTLPPLFMTTSIVTNATMTLETIIPCPTTTSAPEDFRQSGNYYTAGCSNRSLGAGYKTLDTNFLYAYPIYFPASTTINAMATQNGGKGAGTWNVRLGLYSSTSDTNLYPNAKVTPGDLEINIPSSTNTVHSISFADTVLSPGLYWAVILSNLGAEGVGGGSYPLLNASTGSFVSLLGAPSGIWTGATAFGEAWKVAFSYAALPSTFPGSAVVYPDSSANTKVHMVIGVKVA